MISLILKLFFLFFHKHTNDFIALNLILSKYGAHLKLDFLILTPLSVSILLSFTPTISLNFWILSLLNMSSWRSLKLISSPCYWKCLFHWAFLPGNVPGTGNAYEMPVKCPQTVIEYLLYAKCIRRCFLGLSLEKGTGNCEMSGKFNGKREGVRQAGGCIFALVFLALMLNKVCLFDFLGSILF